MRKAEYNRRAASLLAGMMAAALFLEGTSAGVRAFAEEAATEHADRVSDEDLYFGWSGGSGRVSLACGSVDTSEDGTTAEIIFSSSHYSQVKVEDTTYEPVQDADAIDGQALDDYSVFFLPVRLDAEMTIVGTTTAMSQPHDVEYAIYIGSREVAETYDHSFAAGDISGLAGHSGSGAQQTEKASGDTLSSIGDPLEIEGLTFESSEEPETAEGFRIDYYGDGYKVVRIPESADYLVVPEGAGVPGNLPEGVTVLQQPLDQVYVAATAAMSFFDVLDVMEAATMTSLDRDDWKIDAPKEAYEAGTLRFAGRYSAPDYELLVGQGCDLALESTMILHTPEVQEMLEKLGIPVMIERSSYETTALGRVEWIKVYGALFNRKDEADQFYGDQKKEIEDVAADTSDTDEKKTVVFFAVNTDATITVRRSSDIIPDMIRQAGGTYLFEDLDSAAGGRVSVDLSMEEFYSRAKDADYIVYNSTIEAPLGGVEDLLEKSELFADFKAVKNGNVWQADKSWYQSTSRMADMIRDFHTMLYGGDESRTEFLTKLE